MVIFHSHVSLPEGYLTNQSGFFTCKKETSAKLKQDEKAQIRGSLYLSPKNKILENHTNTIYMSMTAGKKAYRPK